VVPQVFWSAKARRNVRLLFVASIFVNIGMWYERFNIVVISLSRDFLPSSWSHYTPSPVEVGILLGSFGLFFTCFLLFVRFAPAVSFHEVKVTLSEQKHGAHHGEVSEPSSPRSNWTTTAFGDAAVPPARGES
jgi:molybdopterin-containing oxidoreductase family membrane subunit